MVAYLNTEKARWTVSEMTKDIHHLDMDRSKTEFFSSLGTVPLLMLRNDSNGFAFERNSLGKKEVQRC